MQSFIKKRIITLLELLPMGRDIYLHLARERLGISYRGVYASRQEALAAANEKNSEYDVVNRNKASNQAVEEQGLETLLRHYDYPLLFWLSQLLPQNPRLLELGGSIGHLYFTSKKYMQHPDSLDWTIAELPEAVKLGNEIAQQRGATQLRFIDSSHMQAAEAADIFVTAGTLQYMQQDMRELLEGLTSLPKHVLINYTPIHADKTGWTLQNLGVCEVPYCIFARQALYADMEALGYKLVTDWESQRALEIPFHSELNLKAYSGCLFSQPFASL